MNTKFLNLDGRHKLAILGAIVAWGISVYFSKQGFAVDATKAQWVGWVLAGVVTVVELVFNSKAQKLSLTLIVVGILCYLYGVWTNIVGFWSYQHPGIAIAWLQQKSVMSIFVGSILEILPEPLFMWGLGAELEGDLLGNLMGFWNGDLNYAKPHQAQTTFVRPVQKTDTESKPYIAPINPNWKHKNKDPHKGDPRKVVSKMFLNQHTDQYKVKR